jgi:ABC-type lipoprotein export system ATPase subunit
LPSILSVRNVVKDYTSEGVPVRALDGVSLEVESGELVALVGRSGCGKSTLLNMAGAMDFPSSGEVSIEGVITSTLDDSGLTRLRRTRIGFVFQSFQLMPTLTVAENVELPLMLAGQSAGVRQRALASLRDADVEEFASRMPYQLSGGQMQRVAIARALVHKPLLLLADEPTGNLDSGTGDRILELLRRLCNERGTAIMMATHSSEAASIADVIVKMRDGRVESECRTSPSLAG